MSSEEHYESTIALRTVKALLEQKVLRLEQEQAKRLEAQREVRLLGVENLGKNQEEK